MTPCIALLQRTDTEISVELANGNGKVTVAATLEREGDLENVKLRNLDYSRWDTKGRGGVDDLTALTHLHEPAILDVLVRRKAGRGADTSPASAPPAHTCRAQSLRYFNDAIKIAKSNLWPL